MVIRGINSELELTIEGYEEDEPSPDEWLKFKIIIKENGKTHEYHESGPLGVDEARHLCQWLSDVSKYPTLDKTLYDKHGNHEMAFTEPDFEFSFCSYEMDYNLLVFSYDKHSHPVILIIHKADLRRAVLQFKEELSHFPSRNLEVYTMPKGVINLSREESLRDEWEIVEFGSSYDPFTWRDACALAKCWIEKGWQLGLGDGWNWKEKEDNIFRLFKRKPSKEK